MSGDMSLLMFLVVLHPLAFFIGFNYLVVDIYLFMSLFHKVLCPLHVPVAACTFLRRFASIGSELSLQRLVCWQADELIFN